MAESDDTRSGAVEFDSAESEVTKLDATQPNAAQPNAAQPNAAQPNAARPNDEPTAAAKNPGRTWRRILAWVLLVLGCILLPLAVTGDWVRGAVMNTDGFVSTVAPLASEPAVQETIADTVTNQLFERLALEQRLRDLFPNRLSFLAAPLMRQLQEWANEAARRFVAGDRFPAMWTAAVRATHSSVVAFMNGSGRVALGEEGVIYLDLSGISIRILDRLQQVGINLPENLSPVLTSGKVPLAKVAKLEKARSLLSLLNKLFIALPILAVLFLAGSVAVATRRQRAVARAGIGIMISMAVFVVILLVARTILIDSIEAAGIPNAAATVMWGHLTIALRGTAWGLFFLGLLLLIYPQVLRAFKSNAMSRAAGRTVEAGWDTRVVGRWVSRHRMWLSIGLLIVGFLVLVLWNRPSLTVIVVTAVLVVLSVGLVFFFARQSDLVEQAKAGLAASTLDGALVPDSASTPDGTSAPGEAPATESQLGPEDEHRLR